jgi:hypothetical protein
MMKAVWASWIRVVSAGVLLLGLVSCGEQTRQGTSSSVLVVTELVAAPGSDPTTFGAYLYSDVQTVVDDSPTVYPDKGRVTIALQLKDPGTAGSPNEPSLNNSVTIDRYHVKYVRADGHNIQGVDVPYEFDSGLGFTVTGDTSMSESFELVRHIAKLEAPLKALGTSPVIINTIAQVTFYGHDQTGRSVSTAANIGIEFGNFADPK